MSIPISVADVVRTRGDTYRIVFRVKEKHTDASVDITSWTAFIMTVDPSKEPTDTSKNIGQIAGVIIDGATGVVGFSPVGAVSEATPGKYHYDCQAVDDNGEKRTFIKGKYEVKQDITKD